MRQVAMYASSNEPGCLHEQPTQLHAQHKNLLDFQSNEHPEVQKNTTVLQCKSDIFKDSIYCYLFAT